jgi:hypothetical protein
MNLKIKKIKIKKGEISDVNTLSNNQIINKTRMELLLVVNIGRVPLKLVMAIICVEFFKIKACK